jgi:hypothetical protein
MNLAKFKQNTTLRTFYYFIFVLKNGGKADPSKCKKTLKISARYIHFIGYFFKAIEDCADSQLFGTMVRPIMCSWCTGTGIAHPSSLLFCLKKKHRNRTGSFPSRHLCCGFGSGIRDQVPFRPLDRGWIKNRIRNSGSGMKNQDRISESLETILGVADVDLGPRMEKIRIQDKHPGSARLLVTELF